MNKIKVENSKLKIGIVCYPSVGGSGIVATNLGNELAKLGHKVHFISYEEPFLLNQNKKNIFFHKVHISEYSLFKYPDYTLPLAVEIEKVQRKFKLDLFHVHYAVPHATAALLARRIMRANNTPLPKIITTLHGTDITLLEKDKTLIDIIKYSVERSHGVTAVSQSLKNDTIKYLKTNKQIEVIHNFYTPPQVTKSRELMRKELDINKNDFVVIHLSNLRPVKRIPDLLKIAAKMKHHKNFKLLILSGGDFAPYKSLVIKLGLTKNLIVKSNIKDIQNYINASDVGIYPSQTESFGMGILETMSYQKPILATKVGGVPEVVTNGQTGFLFPVGDVTNFAKKLDWLIKNPLKLEVMGLEAKKQACEKFCSSVIVPKYVEYYLSILQQP